MPPRFSGLGVREDFLWMVGTWGASMEVCGKVATAGCEGEARERGTSFPELDFVLYDGLLLREGRTGGVGREMSE